MNVPGAPVLLAALQSYQDTGPDSGSRAIVGAIVIVVLAAAIMGIGQMMTGKPKA